MSIPLGKKASAAAGLNYGRVCRQSEKDGTERVALLYSPGAGNDLQGRVARAVEQSAFATITAVNPRGEGREVNTHSPQDSCPVNRVESIRHIHRDGDLACVRPVPGEPLPSDVNNGFTSVGRPDPQLQRFEDLAGPFGD